MTDARSSALPEPLSGVLSEARSRMESGLAEAELELIVARARGLELRQTIALKRREIAQVTLAGPAPVSVAAPPSAPAVEPSVRLRVNLDTPIRIPEAPEVPVVAPAPVSAERPPAGPPVERPSAQARWLPRRWRLALARLARCEPASLAKVLSPNVVVRLGGEHPLSGMWLGAKKATPELARLCSFVEPGTLVVTDIRSDEGTVEVAARLTLTAPSVPVPLDSSVTAVVRFDEAGRIGLLSITPADDRLVDRFFRLATDGATGSG